jgi:hypothetical protein
MAAKPPAKPPAAAKPATAKPPAAKKAKPAPVDDSGTESDDTDGDDDDDDVAGGGGGLGMFEGDGAGDDEDDDEDEDDGDNTIDVEFNFLDPREIHFKSVRRLLEHFLPGEEEAFNVSAMADAIVAQVAVGSMVTVNDDALDVYAFATVLPVALYKVRALRACVRALRARRACVRARRACVCTRSCPSGDGSSRGDPTHGARGMLHAHSTRGRLQLSPWRPLRARRGAALPGT